MRCAWMFAACAALFVCTLLPAGCGRSAVSPSGTAEQSGWDAPAVTRIEQDDAAGDEAAHAMGGEAEPKQPAAGPLKAPARKIIFNAELDLVVEDFSPVAGKVHALVSRFDAFVANSRLGGSQGRPRRGEWQIRVPAQRFDDFVAAARDLGEIRTVSTRSQEVTEEFFDLEARIRNSKQEEARLLKLLDERTGKLEDVLAVEREIARVRGEVERMEGRLRVLSDLTSLATVTLRCEEIRDYRPEQAPTFATQIRRVFEGSWSALVLVGQKVLLALVALAPWLAVLSIPSLLAAVILRRRLRRPLPAGA
ncbi:MAG: DUF4349 domain-containing protein [Pirellulales bacterium]